MKKPKKFTMKKWMYGLLFLALAATQSCKDAPNDVTPPAGGNPSGYADYLVLNNPVKVQGALPVAPPGQLAINIRDTIYTMKGHPYMARVAFLHDPEMKITGFNVAVSGLEDSYYYDVPAEEWQSVDSVAVVYIGLQPPEENEEINYPYTVKFYIQPHNDVGEVVDEFTREITAEDPEDPDKKTLWDENTAWEWLYSAHWNFQYTFIRQVQAPSFNGDIEPDDGYDFSGCCINDVYYRAGDPIDKDGSCSASSKYSQYYTTIKVTAPDYTIGYQYLFLYHDGNFLHNASSEQFIFDPAKSICLRDDYFRPDAEEYNKSGTYTYTPSGSNTGTIEFKTRASNSPFGPTPPTPAQYIYTDHFLIMVSGFEEKSDHYFMRHGYDPVFDVEEFKKQYWRYE